MCIIREVARGGSSMMFRADILFWVAWLLLYLCSNNVRADDVRWTQKPFSTLWDRLLEFEYPREDSMVIDSWGVGYWQEPGVGGVYRMLLTESRNKANRMYI